MKLYIGLLGKTIPTYGLMIMSGVIVANIIALFLLRRTKQEVNDFIILEAYGILGGFVGGICTVLLAGRLHRIETGGYITNFIFLVPLIQGFGRVGCFFAGCCYGIPYDGIGAVVFPENSYALPGG